MSILGQSDFHGLLFIIYMNILKASKQDICNMQNKLFTIYALMIDSVVVEGQRIMGSLKKKEMKGVTVK